MDTSHPTLRRRSVLVVEDHSCVRETLGFILEETYDVLFAEDGPPALRLLESRRIDAVLLDLGLREMEGFEVLARIRAISPSVPVIIVTVRNTAADAVRALKLGARDYLTKPFDEEIVLTKLAEALAVSLPVETRDGDRGEGCKDSARHRPASPDGYLRPRCLVIASHIGTAGTLRLILDRYVPTNAATNSLNAARLLGVGHPDCVVVDDSAWANGGSALARILRMRAPTVRVALLTDSDSTNAPGTSTADSDVAHHTRLDEVVRYALETFALARPTTLPDGPLSDRILAALDYLRRHYADELSTNEIAQAATMSRSSLAEQFRAELGTSVRRFVMRLRVEVARLLLTERGTKLDQVAALAGFGDPSHLSRAFRAQTGYRPGAYRRLLWSWIVASAPAVFS